QFGAIIAYLLPGFIALAGMAPLFPWIGYWLQPVTTGQLDLGLGPPLYAVLAATALGLVLSCFRWVLLDHAHHWLGVRRPIWEDSQLDRVLGGFDYLVQSHFRYYEFAGNTLLATLWAYGINRLAATWPFLGVWSDLTMAAVVLVLFVASRNALRNYYTRTSRLIGRATFGDDAMYNGNDHGGRDSKPSASPATPPATPKAPAPEQQPKPQAPSSGSR
ncbi:MAG TPA: hypothetical protein VEQ85_06655, partial [Lacipirellulaceae bacterium]|nr:hypothetical protein [Lacipirellulaceae bacterium]